MKPIEKFSGDRIYIDASIFLCYLLGVDDPSLERKTKGFLERLKEKKFEGIVSPLVVDEIIFNYIGGLIKSREGVNISDVSGRPRRK